MSEFFPELYGHWLAFGDLFSFISMFIDMFLDWVFQVINNKAQGIQKPVSSTTGKKHRFTLLEMGEEERAMGTAPGAARSQPVLLRDGCAPLYDRFTWGGWLWDPMVLTALVRCWLPFTSIVGRGTLPPTPGPWSCGPSVECAGFSGLQWSTFWFSLCLPGRVGQGARFQWSLSVPPAF